MKKDIKLNCDMGESFGVYNMGMDEKIMPYIDMANLACGFHASDPVTMHQSIQDAKAHGVRIGAHPSFPDLLGFGRRYMQCSVEEIISFVIYQCGALDALCKSHDQKVTYLKPHGALYNTMMVDEEVFKAICKAVSKYDNDIELMILSNTDHESYAKKAAKYGINLIYEVFADRAYNDDGSLVSRKQNGAVIHEADSVIERAKTLQTKGIIETQNGKQLSIPSDTLCVHGDNETALELIKALHALNR